MRTATDALRILRRATPLVPEHLALLIELAALEWKQERRRLTRAAACAAVAVFAAFMLLLAGTGLILASAWDTAWRELAIGLLLGLYATLLAAAVFLLWRLTRRERGAFADTRAELHRDLDVFREPS